jgi:molybdate-binding protein
MGASGEDVQLSAAARKLIPFQIECKNKATSQIHTYYEQAKSHGEHEPLVIVKKDRDVTLAIVSMAAFLKLLRNQNADRS